MMPVPYQKTDQHEGNHLRLMSISCKTEQAGLYLNKKTLTNKTLLLLDITLQTSGECLAMQLLDCTQGYKTLLLLDITNRQEKENLKFSTAF